MKIESARNCWRNTGLLEGKPGGAGASEIVQALKVKVHKAAWLVFVLPSASYSKFPHQCATAGPGEQQRTAGHIRPHTQAKLAKQLDHQGKPPANVAAMRDTLTTLQTNRCRALQISTSPVLLYTGCTARAGYVHRSISPLLRDSMRDESKTLEDFVDCLTMYTHHKAEMKMLKHETFQDQRTYRGLGLFGPAAAAAAAAAAAPDAAPAPAPACAPGHARTAVRSKRKVVADGAGGGSSPHHARTKRARRGRRNNVADK